MKELRVALIYHKQNRFLSGNHFDNTYYNFFINALQRNTKISVKNYPTDDVFDASILDNKFDIILLWSNADFGMPQEILNIQRLKIPVIARSADPRDSKKASRNHDRWKIDYYFHFHSESFFHKLYPTHFKYKKIFYGVEPSSFQNLKPYNKRIKNKILNSGNVGNLHFFSRIINDIKDPKWNNYRCKVLRTKCNKLSYVDYTPTLEHQFVNDKYPLLLEKYCTAIAADTYIPVIKYWELPAAGCLTFMEITEKNQGKHIGFKDGTNAIFINEKNYEEKFEDYLSDTDNPKWQEIADAGRKYALEQFNNDKATESLVELMHDII
jgi:hypothetical protein